MIGPFLILMNFIGTGKSIWKMNFFSIYILVFFNFYFFIFSFLLFVVLFFCKFDNKFKEIMVSERTTLFLVQSINHINIINNFR
jgi:hypothetical protein